MTTPGRYRLAMARRAASPAGVADGAIAIGVAVFSLSGALIVGAAADEPDLRLVGAALLLGQAAPLWWRRRAPVAVWLVVGVAAAAYGMGPWPDPLLPLGPMVALATVVELDPRRTAAVVWLVSAAVTLVGLLATGDSGALDAWVAAVALIVAPLAGDWLRTRAAHLARLEEDALRAEDDRRRAVQDARRVERAHLARELHDVVAHHVSMMVVQAEAGAARADGGTPDGADGAAEAFDGIAETGRGALVELRRLLTILRTDEHRAPTAPQPGLEEIAALVDQVRSAGLEVDLRLDGAPGPVAPAVALSAYRVVQEGLTNVVKHAGAAHAEVSVRQDPEGIEVAVVDDGAAGPVRPGAVDQPPAGHGLEGLRERVTLLHGRLDAAPRAGGGYALRAWMPRA